MRQTHSKFWWLEVLPSVKSTDCLTFSSFLEEVKDEIQNSLGRCCLYIHYIYLLKILFLNILPQLFIIPKY